VQCIFKIFEAECLSLGLFLVLFLFIIILAEVVGPGLFLPVVSVAEVLL
jgi:hypothetical protein